jgi:[protein-PII] uridylyltransferase
VRNRHLTAGEVAFLLEPDVKEGRGGLRDVHAIRWAQLARPVMLEGDDAALDEAYEVVLRIRDALHRVTGRRGDQLLLQDQDAVAEAAGEPDADALVRSLARAARTIAWRSDEVWERVEASLEGPVGRLARRDKPCGPGVVLRDAQVHATGEPEPTVVLDVAVAAARHGAPIDRSTLSRLAGLRPATPFPWSPARREAFVELLASGPGLLRVIESLDQYGLWTWLVPEWDHIRSLPQRNAYHSFTVDRHLAETVVNAAALTPRVHRPDLLVMGALLHDIGKGRSGDHTEIGIPMAVAVMERMGFPAADVDVVADLVRHHLLLADLATRRDVEDDATVRAVTAAVGSIRTLELLAALTEADSLATGPSAWSSWKASLLDRLVERSTARLQGAPGQDDGGSRTPDGASPFPTRAQLELAGRGGVALVPEATALTVVAPDRPGLFGTVAGGLALAGLDVLAAQVHTEGGMAIERFEVRSQLDASIDWDRATRQIEAALEGRVALAARLAERARRYDRRRPVSADAASVTVRVDPDASDRATVVEVLAPDGVGLLHRLTRAIAELGLDVRTARVQTLADRAVDVFYLVGPGGGKITDATYLRELERALEHAVEG